MKKVSVIVPVYNMEQYIQETLLSIAQSDYHKFEVIVVDDGSTDRSLSIARQFADYDKRFIVISQTNKGVSAARNNAIMHSSGEYILPVDADNRIAPDYISKAAAVLDANPQIKVVSAQAEFFGEKSGLWQLPPFSLPLLARKNLIDTCAMYRRSDYDQTGGYCEYFTAREDWDFWLSMFERGGEFYRLPDIGFYYRVRKYSKRIQDRKFKRELIDNLNHRHHDFIYKHLSGPLRYHRTWSRLINKIHTLLRLPQ